MNLNVNQLSAIIGHNPNIQSWLDALNKILPDYEITTAERIAAFLAETAYESTNFTETQENLNYSSAGLLRTFPTHFSSCADADNYANKPEAIANRVYANRFGNGNESSGDGWKFSGKGLIQLTFKENYQSFADSIEMTLDDTATYLQSFEGCVQVAANFWETKNLNTLADAKNIDAISIAINGGTIGLEERRANYNIVLGALNV